MQKNLEFFLVLFFSVAIAILKLHYVYYRIEQRNKYVDLFELGSPLYKKGDTNMLSEGKEEPYKTVWN